MENLATDGAFPMEEVLLRLGLAAVFGVILGLDRELRGISAGIRTHALVCVSSAVLTLSSLMMFLDVRAHGGTDIDPLRVIQGLAQAIGFIAAGLIFVSKGNVHNLTSAANIWLATAVGIAAGAGQHELAAVSIGLGVVIVTVMRVFERFLPGSPKAREEE
jgi:putative Mg2+ transporter-C (MgtC) family protein